MSLISSPQLNYAGISIFTIGIIIHTFLNIKRRKKVRFANLEPIQTEFNESNIIDIIDELNGYYLSKPNKNFELKEECLITNKETSKTSEVIDNSANEKTIEDNKNDSHITNKIFENKSDAEITFEKSNPDEIIIKIICPNGEKISWDIELKMKKIISKTTNKNINLILENCGGNFMSGMQICNILHIYKKLNPQSKIKVFIPEYSLSTGTYIALMADELYLNDYAFLSPVDVQIMLEQEFYSVNEIIEYSENENSKVMDLERNSLIMSCCAKRYVNASVKCFNKYIFNNCSKYTPKTRKIIIDKFVHSKLPHNISFDKEDIEETGIKIAGTVPQEIMEIYEQAIKLK